MMALSKSFQKSSASSMLWAMQRWTLSVSLLTALTLLGTMGQDAHASTPFAAFESGQVRPLALSPSGDRLFAVNTPDNRLEIYDVTVNGLEHYASVPV